MARKGVKPLVPIPLADTLSHLWCDRWKDAFAEFERAWLIILLDKYGTICQAAKAAKINRTDFYKRLYRRGLKPPGNAKTANRGNAAWRRLL